MTALIDQVLPEYDQRERHSRLIASSSEQVWCALDELRVVDLTRSMALLRLRGGPSAWLNGVEKPPDMRALDAFAPRPLIADAPRELVLGDIGRYASLHPIRPDLARGDLEAFQTFSEFGWSKVAMNFRLNQDESGRTMLTTETRVRGTDAGTRRRFRFYWLLVRLGSGLVRRDILDGIARTVKQPAPV